MDKDGRKSSDNFYSSLIGLALLANKVLHVDEICGYIRREHSSCSVTAPELMRCVQDCLSNSGLFQKTTCCEGADDSRSCWEIVPESREKLSSEVLAFIEHLAAARERANRVQPTSACLSGSGDEKSEPPAATDSGHEETVTDDTSGKLPPVLVELFRHPEPPPVAPPTYIPMTPQHQMASMPHASLSGPPTPAQPPAAPVQPPATPAQPPTTTPARPPATPGQPPATPVRPPATPARPPATPARPPAIPARPTLTPRASVTPGHPDQHRTDQYYRQDCPPPRFPLQLPPVYSVQQQGCPLIPGVHMGFLPQPNVFFQQFPDNTGVWLDFSHMAGHPTPQVGYVHQISPGKWNNCMNDGPVHSPSNHRPALLPRQPFNQVAFNDQQQPRFGFGPCNRPPPHFQPPMMHNYPPNYPPNGPVRGFHPGPPLPTFPRPPNPPVTPLKQSRNDQYHCSEALATTVKRTPTHNLSTVNGQPHSTEQELVKNQSQPSSVIGTCAHNSVDNTAGYLQSATKDEVGHSCPEHTDAQRTDHPPKSKPTRNRTSSEASTTSGLSVSTHTSKCDKTSNGRKETSDQALNSPCGETTHAREFYGEWLAKCLLATEEAYEPLHADDIEHSLGYSLASHILGDFRNLNPPSQQDNSTHDKTTDLNIDEVFSALNMVCNFTIVTNDTQQQETCKQSIPSSPPMQESSWSGSTCKVNSCTPLLRGATGRSTAACPSIPPGFEAHFRAKDRGKSHKKEEVFTAPPQDEGSLVLTAV